MDSQNTELPSSATRQGDYDETFPRFDSAVFLGVGIGLLKAYLAIAEQGGKYNFYINLTLHIIGPAYAYHVAYKLNRGKYSWASFALCLPPIALIILGRMKKMNYQLVVNEKFPEHIRYKVVKRQGEDFFKNKMYFESNKAYEYIVTRLSPTSEDMERYSQLQNLIK